MLKAKLGLAFINLSTNCKFNLNYSNRLMIMQKLEQALAEKSHSVLIFGEGEIYSDDSVFDGFKTKDYLKIPSIIDINKKIEKMPCPVIFCVKGNCFSWGLETALSCHWRVLSQKSQLGFPSVKLGISTGNFFQQRYILYISIINNIS